MIGKLLGQYTVLGRLGAGGMGEVFRALDTTLDREVALKMLPIEVASDPDRLARFEREAKALAALQHPNIVTIHSVEQAEGVHFLTMELVEGKTLSQLIPVGGMSLEQIFDVAIPLADALAAAHDKGVIHRDLKPSNVMVSAEGWVKILDFGLVKLRAESAPEEATVQPTENLTREGVVLGTAPYMSPEQLEGKALDDRSDIFALGVILFEMATGERPFQGDSWASLALAIMRETPSDVDSVREDLPHHLGRIIRHSLEKEPNQRFQTARDVRNELEDLQKESTSGGVLAAGAGPLADAGDVPAKAPDTRRSRWFLAAAALIVVVAGSAWLISRTGPSDEATTASESAPLRIVVLPFENLGPPEDEYFADGVTEELTSRLAAASGLSVISRTTAMQYKEERPSLDQIGRELGIDYALEGTVRWARGADGSSRVRVTPQLIRVSDDSHVWTDSYDRVLDDIFNIQSELAQQVLAELSILLSDSELTLMEVRPTRSLEAYQAYLRGRHFSTKPHFTSADLNEAQASFQRAVELDPEFALAWAEISKAHAEMIYYMSDTSEERRSLARQAIDRAAECSPDSPEVRLALGYYYLWAERDAERAGEEFEIAARDLPNSADLFMGKGELARMRGHMEEAVADYAKAAELSPLEASPVLEVGITQWAMRHHQEAEDSFNRAIALAPDQAWPYLMKVWNYWSWKGAVPEARVALQGAENHPWTPYLGFWQEVYDGRYDEALVWLDRNPGEWLRLKMWVRPEVLLRAYVHQFRGEPDLARAAFEEAAVMLEAEVRVHPDEPRAHSSLGIAYAALGRGEEAVEHGIRATELFPLSVDAAYALPHAYDLALIYTQVGEYDIAFDELDRLMSIPGWITIPVLEMDPRWAPLREHPRYRALVAKYG